MKKTSFLITFSLIAFMTSSSWGAAARTCNITLLTEEQKTEAMAGRLRGQKIDYRQIQNPDQFGQLTSTDEKRDKAINSGVKDGAIYVLDQVAALMSMQLEPSVNIVDYHESLGYKVKEPDGSVSIDRYKVNNIGADGNLHVSLILTVSAHTSLEDAFKWAKTDTYTIWIQTVGKLETRRKLIADAKSLGAVTVQDVAIPIALNETVEIAYDRKGSAGPWGYREGRVIAITRVP